MRQPPYLIITASARTADRYGKDNEFIDNPARMTELVRQDMLLKFFRSLTMSKSNISWGGEVMSYRQPCPAFRTFGRKCFLCTRLFRTRDGDNRHCRSGAAEAIFRDECRSKPFERLRCSRILSCNRFCKLGSFLGSKYYQWKDVVKRRRQYSGLTKPVRRCLALAQHRFLLRSSTK